MSFNNLTLENQLIPGANLEAIGEAKARNLFGTIQFQSPLSGCS